MRIGLVLPKLATGGAEQVVLSLARYYHGKGHETHVLTLEGGGSMRERFMGLGFGVHELSCGRSGQRGIRWAVSVARCHSELASIMRRERLSVVHTHLMGPDLDGLVAAKLARVPAIVHTVHNSYPGMWTKGLGPRLSVSIRRQAYRAYDAIFAVSEGAKEWLVDTGLATRERVQVVENGVEFAPIATLYTRADARRELGWREDEKVLLNVASLTEQKNQVVLVEAAARLRPMHPTLRIVVAGEGPLRERLQQRARDAGLGRTFELLGKRDDVPRLLAAADAFVFPSLWEGLPIALLEACGAGVPVIVSAIEAHERLLSSEEQSLMVPPRDASSLAAAIEALLANPASAESRARGAQKHVRDRYSVERMAETYLVSYEGLRQGS